MRLWLGMAVAAALVGGGARAGTTAEEKVYLGSLTTPIYDHVGTGTFMPSDPRYTADLYGDISGGATHAHAVLTTLAGFPSGTNGYAEVVVSDELKLDFSLGLNRANETIADLGGNLVFHEHFDGKVVGGDGSSIFGSTYASYVDLSGRTQLAQDFQAAFATVSKTYDIILPLRNLGKVDRVTLDLYQSLSVLARLQNNALLPSAGVYADHTYSIDGFAYYDAAGHYVPGATLVGDNGFRFAEYDADHPIGSAPEPATWALALLGFGLSGAALRRRRAVAA